MFILGNDTQPLERFALEYANDGALPVIPSCTTPLPITH